MANGLTRQDSRDAEAERGYLLALAALWMSDWSEQHPRLLSVGAGVRTGRAGQSLSAAFAILLAAAIQQQVRSAGTALLAPFGAGELTVPALASQMRILLRPAHIQMARLGAIAAGGAIVAGAGAAAWADQDAYLARMEGQADRLSPGAVAGRVGLYLDAVRGTFNDYWVRHLPAGAAVRWLMNPLKEHCPDCIYASSHNSSGLPPGHWRKAEIPYIPGHTTRCISNCGCRLERIGGGTGTLPPENAPVTGEGGQQIG